VSHEITGPYVDPTPPAAGARFATGELLSGRYRVVAPLGKGGMGEVFRADDLALGQPVALKFLPLHLAADPDRLARFRKEVATARGVSHPNVCRVYDLGDHAGQLFLAMEYIDGEDLASLLRRVGRLPEEKGVEIARQLCLALAAVHQQGLLHRDLKPANVMLDGRGKVRLTDFSLAAVAGEVADARSGTPAYEAPEQLAGREVTARSDLFALGLVLYEVFTGRRAFPGTTRNELALAYESGSPSKPSSHVSGLNPAVERVLLRCLEREPKDRPRSAYEVLAGLPGGDPLAAALAAGDTPSPQMIADAPVEGRLSPAVGLALLAAVLIGIGLMAVLADRTMLFRQVALNRPPEVMAQQAQDLLERLSHADPPADRYFRYQYDVDYLRHVRDTDRSPERWTGLKSRRPDPVVFFYRQSPGPLIAFPSNDVGTPWPITALNPPPLLPGMAGAELDGHGRLLSLYVLPPEQDRTPPARLPDWRPLFDAAGLDFDKLRPTDPEWTSPASCDVRAAWRGTYPGRPDLPLRVEAGAWRGKPAFFKTIGENWARPERETLHLPRELWVFVLIVTLLLVGVGLAARNLWLGRGDRRGVWKICLAFVILEMVGLAGVSSFSLSADGLTALTAWLGVLGFSGIMIGVWYLALEPTVRRRWPWRIVAWGRLLDGRFRDPLIGRDLLIGLVTGTLLALLPKLLLICAGWFGPPPMPLTFSRAPLSQIGPPPGWGMLATFAGFALSGSMINFMLAFVLYLILRKQWLSCTAYVLLFTALSGAKVSEPEFIVEMLVASLVMVLLMSCVGLLALTCCLLAFNLLSLAPLTTDLSAWYAQQAVVPVLVVVGLAVYGFVVSVGVTRLALPGFFGDD
jgi:serine/threonine-protein kinase